MATEGIKFEPPAQSRDEDILYTTLQGQLYEKEAESRIEDLLIQLNESIVSGGGGGFTPTESQLDAMNSGITAEDVELIDTNKNNILLLENNIELMEQYTVINILPYSLAQLKSINVGGIWTDNVYEYNNITFTVNADMSIALNGIYNGSGNTVFTLVNQATGIKRISTGDYILSGCPPTGANNKYYLNAYNPNSSTESATDYGEGVEVYINYENALSANIAIVVRANVNVNNLTFKPMLRNKRIINSDYQPYAMTNAELTAAIQAIQAQLAGQ